MANEFMTRDEATLKIAIPLLRSMIKRAAEVAEQRPLQEEASICNPIRDLLPLSFDLNDLRNGGASELLDQVDKLEAALRDKVRR